MKISIFHCEADVRPSSISKLSKAGALAIWEMVNGILGVGLITIIRLYQVLISPLLAVIFGPTAGCRFTPTCSCYAREAVQKHGAVIGTWLATKRVCRCHPWGGSGEDPVPHKIEFPISKLKPPAALTHGS